MPNRIDLLIATLIEGVQSLEQLANDAHDLLEAQMSRDTEEFLLHRAEIITSEIALLRKQLQQLINRLERER